MVGEGQKGQRLNEAIRVRRGAPGRLPRLRVKRSIGRGVALTFEDPVCRVVIPSGPRSRTRTHSNLASTIALRLPYEKIQMTRQIIRTVDAPGSTLFSQAIKVGSTIYMSGIAGLDPSTNQLSGSTIQEQTRQALINCERILSAAGAQLENVVEVHVLLAQPNDFAGLNEEYAKFFPTDPPTRAVSKLGVEIPGLLVSIKMTAVLGDQ